MIGSSNANHWSHSKRVSHTEKTGELHTSLPMGCTWATECATRGLSVGILPCKLGCPLLPYMETVGSSVGSSVGSPLLLNMKKSAAQWAAEWAAHGLLIGILPCKLHCPLLPYMETGDSSMGSAQLPNMKKVGSSVGNGVACPCATHGNFAMQIRLPTTVIYGYSG